MAYMNYISEINGFERWLETHQLPTTAQLLWYKIAYWSSRAGWPEWTQVDNRRLMVSLQIAREASLTESRERLVNAGLIEYQKGKKGTPGRYRIISFEGNTTEYPCNLKVQTEVQNVVYPVVYPEVQTVGIIKDKKKNKRKKSIANAIPEKCTQKPDGEGEREGIKAALERYIAHREAMGNPLTGPGLDMLLKRLEELAPGNEPDKAAILEQSVRNGWKDVYVLGRDKRKSDPVPNHNRFHNLDPSGTDYDALMMERVQARMRK